jgi:small subunit ribosomal protein S16
LSVKLRLMRMGNVNRPYYRVVAIDSRMRRDGRSIETLGSYDPLKRPANVTLKEEPILSWLDRGAEPSPTVRELLRQRGILLKWELMRKGVSAAEATQRVAATLDKQVVKPKRQRQSKKAQAKAAAAGGAPA